MEIPIRVYRPLTVEMAVNLMEINPKFVICEGRVFNEKDLEHAKKVDRFPKSRENLRL